MPEIENHCNDHFQTNAGSMELEERLWWAKENKLDPKLFLFESGMRIIPNQG